MPATDKITNPVSGAIRDAVTAFDEMVFVQRISRITITPQPNAVVFDFTTIRPTNPIVEIFRLVKDSKGTLLFSSADSVGLAFGLLFDGRFTEHHARVPRLDQNTSYSYRISADDGPRPGAVAIGEFKTGIRSADVVIREIQVWTDGDPGLRGSGEFQFGFGFYNEDDGLVASRNFSRDISAGEIVNLPFGTGAAFRMANAPDSVALFVNAREYDDNIGTTFHSLLPVPIHLPEEPSNEEDDDGESASAIQRLDLPNEHREFDRITFSLNSGPHAIFYVANGWITVQVTNPPPSTVRNFASRSHTSVTSTILGGFGGLRAVTPPGGKPIHFGLGAHGLIAYRLPRVPRERERKWARIATGGAESVTLIAQSETHADLIVVDKGLVRASRYTLDQSHAKVNDWVVIGKDLQPALTVLPLEENGTAVLVGLTQSGEVRASLLRSEGLGSLSWTDLGGSFVGRVAAVQTHGGIEFFAVTAEGGVWHTIWQPNVEADYRWLSLGEKNVEFVSASRDKEGKHVVALTRDRNLIGLSTKDARFPKEWRMLGKLDDLGREEQSLASGVVYSDSAQREQPSSSDPYAKKATVSSFSEALDQDRF
jgi:hypothetical protein